MENPGSETRRMFGRRVIRVSAGEITEGNVVEILQKVLPIHERNPGARSNTSGATTRATSLCCAGSRGSVRRSATGS